jgi:hypothetical protein
MGQYDELTDEVTRVLTPEEASAWEGRALEQDWPTGGTQGHARAINDPAPPAGEVTAGRNVEKAPTSTPTPRRRSPADARQEARDNALVLGRHALSLLEQSVDWAMVDDSGSQAAGQKVIDAVAEWNRTRAKHAAPREAIIFDQEQPGHDRKEGSDAL